MTAADSSVLTEELRGWLGWTSQPGPVFVVSASDVRRYVDATGDDNPLWLDDAVARAAGFRGRLLPPLLVGWEPFSVRSGGGSDDLTRSLPWPAGYSNTRNAGTEIEWGDPVCLGDELQAQTRVLDISEHKGRSGVGIYVTGQTTFTNRDGAVVARRTQTIARFPATSVANDTDGQEQA